MFIKPEIAETTGISEIGISFADNFCLLKEIKTIDLAFIDADKENYME